MHQLKAFKHYIYDRKNKLDGMKTECAIYDNNNNNAIAISLPSLRSNKTII